MSADLRYRVTWSRKAMNVLKDQGKMARELGRGIELARVVRVIDERLRSAPTTFGGVYRSRGAIEEFLAVQEFVAIDFAVDVERKFVLVRDCHILS